MRKTLAFRPAAQFEVTLGSASEAFRLRCQAQNLSVGTLGWYKQLLKMFGVQSHQSEPSAIPPTRTHLV